MITIEQLKVLLKIRGITYDLTDEELKTLKDFKIDEISSYINFDLTSTTHSEQKHLHHDRIIYLNHYPVENILNVIIGSEKTRKYTIFKNNGILKFFHPVNDLVFIEYTSSLPYYIVSKIESLIFDMICYDLKEGTTGNISSVSEGGVSVSYDSSNNLGFVIQNKLTDLRNMFSARLKML